MIPDGHIRIVLYKTVLAATIYGAFDESMAANSHLGLGS